MKARILGCVALAGVTALVPAANAATKAHPAHRGVVVDWRAHSHTATLALPGGHLIAVHSTRRVRPGTKVKFATLTQLGNGTFSGSLAKVGRARRTRVIGTVVANLSGGSFVLSGRGTTFVVHHSRSITRAPRRGVKISNEIASPPPVGSTVSTDVSIDSSGSLESKDVNEVSAPDPTQPIDIEGQISAIDPSTSILTVSVTDDGASASFQVVVPAAIGITAYSVGDEVELTATLNPDGTYTLVGSSQNGDSQEADDDASEQGSQPAAGDPTGDATDQSGPSSSDTTGSSSSTTGGGHSSQGGDGQSADH